ncbi:hypothetical protein [Streptomyces sp. NPDC093991]|uniref:hypothetical protein n=1 Tax=unclassified Streptomyces TaxID=2593676 RepID=UPI0034362FB0
MPTVTWASPMASASAATSMNRSGLGTADPGFFGTQEQHATLTSPPEDLTAQLSLPHQQMVSAVAAQRLPRAEGHRFNLLRLP